VSSDAARRAIGARRHALPIDAVAAIDAVLDSEELHTAHENGRCFTVPEAVGALINAWIEEDFDARDDAIDDLDGACRDCVAELVDQLAMRAAHYLGEWINADGDLEELRAERADQPIPWEPVPPGPGQMALPV
jgi:hypothetical protein